jgi:osmoprotectant transport system permease protein
LLGQHIVLVVVATTVATAIGVPLGVFAARRPRLAAPLMATASVVQTVPSLAMFGFLLPVPLIGGVGARAALVVLILYGVLPIVRTTIAGLRGIDASIREAGVAMGMTPRELLRQVELPLALPSIVAGVRVAAVMGVGSATIAAAIGAGGLGEHLSRPVDGRHDRDPPAPFPPPGSPIVDGSLLWPRASSRPPAIRVAARRHHDRRGSDGGGVVRRCRGVADRRHDRSRIEELHRAARPGRTAVGAIEKEAGLPSIGV